MNDDLGEVWNEAGMKNLKTSLLLAGRVFEIKLHASLHVATLMQFIQFHSRYSLSKNNDTRPSIIQTEI